MPGSASAATGAPPFILPGEHFAAALAFLVAGSVGTVAVAPYLAAGAYPAPRVIAVAHLFTLGWITTSILGALYQFLPVALGEPIRSVRLAHGTFVLYVTGLPTFVSGLLLDRPILMASGAVLFATALLLFVGNLGATLTRAKRRDVTWWALAAVAAFLVVTVVLGSALAGNLRWGYLGGRRSLALGVHLHVALAGWVLLVMVGVAHRLLPMFLLSHGAGDRWARASVALVAAGAGVLALLHHAPAPFGTWTPALLIGAGLTCFLLQARQFYRRRHRRSLDPGMRLAAGALGLLALGAGVGAPALLIHGGARFATAYVAAVVLAMSLFVVAHYYKIVPFLVWYHRFGPLAGRRDLPRVADLFSSRVARSAALLLMGGAAALPVAIAAGAADPARWAALPLACGVAIVAGQMLGIARRRP